MAGGKLSPRQKMIGMMYLVLTALLALNISKDILNAFVTVNNGLEKTKNNFRAKNDDLYSAFDKAYTLNEAKVGESYDKAQEVEKLAEEIVSYIDQIKVEIIAGVEPSIPKDKIMGKDEFENDTILNLMNVQVKDNYIVPTNILVGSEPSKPKTGEYSALELQSKLESFRNNLLELIPSESAIAKSLNETFQFGDRKNASGVVENWPSYNFYGVPMAAAVTLLTKTQTDIRNAESDVVKYLFSSVDADDFKFTNLDAAVIPASNYIIVGDTFKADVFLAAFDSTSNPVVTLGEDYDSTKQEVVGDTISVDVKEGKGFVRIPATTQGDYTYKGAIKYLNTSTGLYNSYPYEIQYKVARPSTTISATKMNVFYLGLDNPVDISAPGVAKDQISASITNGSISKSSEGWVVKPGRVGTSTINVTAEVDGRRQNMGSMEFRVKKIPTPIAEVSGKNSGAVPKNKLAATAGIIASMENFEFDVRVVVSSFDFVYVQANGLSKTIPVTGPRFTEAVKNVLRNIAPGSRVTFENIKVRLPDGELRTLSPVVIKAV